MCFTSMKTTATLVISGTGSADNRLGDDHGRRWSPHSSCHYRTHSGAANTPAPCDRCQSLPKTRCRSCWIILYGLCHMLTMLNQLPKYIVRSLALASLVLIAVCLQADQLVATGQVVHDCKSTPSLRDGTPQFLVNEVRKFVDNCIKAKDGIRFRKRLPIFAANKRRRDDDDEVSMRMVANNDEMANELLKVKKDEKQSIRWWMMLMAANSNGMARWVETMPGSDHWTRMQSNNIEAMKRQQQQQQQHGNIEYIDPDDDDTSYDVLG